MKRKKNISILGSTGSIGRQTLDVAARYREELEVVGLAAGRNWPLLLEQAREFRPRVVAVKDAGDAERIKGELPPGTEVFWGSDGLNAVAAVSEADFVVAALTGTVGLVPVMRAIEAGKHIALANKETLVAAGELVTEAVKRKGVRLLPVDSEHSAVWQCIEGREDQVTAVILTASGGPFRGTGLDRLSGVTPAEALRHPTWQMGAKITIDSATLMNKGLEVIEARWLFGVGYDNIEVVIHPQSIVHGMVELRDGTVIACLSQTDMRLPIQYALTYPERKPSVVNRLNFSELGQLTFEAPDTRRFPCLGLAYDAGRTGGTMPCVMNAANEVAVEAFLGGNLGFLRIPEVVTRVMEAHAAVSAPSLEEILEADRWARARASLIVTEVEQ
ncbi:1-deoxy-D-xylulose-5-phosphate reductoisomerase [Desulforudis sp. 1088]|uniref:1-deoxy-D-xylulose-5-phosphate reductoisomerase n=1 Tax=unclassified Candidatus Desulforudis TaxID=2635950 RepID=UPI003478B337